MVRTFLLFAVAGCTAPADAPPPADPHTDPPPVLDDTAVPPDPDPTSQPPTTPPVPYAPTPDTLTGKVMFGYQGWFLAPGDGSQVDSWRHWFRGDPPDETTATFDAWPDLSEFAPDELYETDLTYADGSPVGLFSSHDPRTVDRHFAWMAQHDLDGVFLQRFLGETTDPRFLHHRDAVTQAVMDSAEAHGRVFAIMYDISGGDPATFADDLVADWQHLVDDLGVLSHPRYLHHEGLPMLSIWGPGFTDRPGTAAEVDAMLDELDGVTLMGGLPTWWRDLGGDSKSDPAWADVYRRFDVISPWAVGRFPDQTGADAFAAEPVAGDLAETRALGIDYLPVVWPGFSWINLHDGPFNEIPRDGGRFYWRQVYNVQAAGADMIYVAMFDEVDEATAMFKLAPSSSDTPVEGTWLALDADGEQLPSDWYLQLGNQTGRMLRGEIGLMELPPIAP